MNEHIVEALNDVINEAIYHGGDSGGAYYTNSEDLMYSVNRLLSVLNLDTEYKISELDRYGDYANCYAAIIPKENNI